MSKPKELNFSRIISQFTTTTGRFFSGMRFIKANGLSRFYLAPIALTILLWIGGFSLVANLVDWISAWTHEYLEIEAHPSGEGFFSSFGESWEMLKSWINGASTLLLALMLKLVFWLVLGIVMKYILLILLSPILAYISEKAEAIITGKSYPFDIEQLTRDVWRGILIAGRNFIIEIALIVLMAGLSFLMPPLAPFITIAGFIVGAYFFGYSMIDYISERQQMNMQESNQFVWANAGTAIGLGVFISLALKVPFIGFLLASFTSIIAAVTAVIILQKNEMTSRRLANPQGILELKNEI